jgi:D-sedoheptulose 7-phosphate isomerase
VNDALLEHQRLFASLHSIAPQIDAALQLLKACIIRGNKIMLCGNGGSAADCQHFAAELTGRYKADRHPLAAIALTTDSSALTAIANDYGYQSVFERQVRALGKTWDVLIGISTSGISANVIGALEFAHEVGIGTILLTGGHDLSDMPTLADVVVPVPSKDTPRIQEAHTFILHHWAEEIEAAYLSWPGIF